MSEWYCDVALNGSSVKLVKDSHLEHNGQRISLPNGQNVLYVRIKPDGIRFAGVGHHDDRCWEWDGGRWVMHGIAFGPQSVIYDRDGALHVIGGPPAHGYRYADEANRLITCDETRADVHRQIWDYTELGHGLTIGQGGDKLGHGDDPIIALFEGKRKLLQDGRCRFVNAYRHGENVAYAAVREDTGQALTRLLTLEDIRNAPDCGPVEPPVGEIPEVNRALWYGSFDRDHNASFPGNCRIRWAEHQPATLETLDGTDIAYYVAGHPSDSDVNDMIRAVDAAKQLQPPLPVLCYVPHGAPMPPNADWIGIEGYWKEPLGETLQQFEQARLAKAVEAARPVVLVGQCYTSNAHNTSHLRPLVPVFGRFLRDVQSCKGFVAFSAGKWRATGYEDHPEVHPDYQKLSTSIETPPDNLEPPVSDGPTIDIIDYDKKVSRKDPKGLLVRFDVTSAESVTKISLQMEGDGEPPVAPEFAGAPDGRYLRAMAFKPVRTGEWFPLVKAWDASGRIGTARGDTKVKVTEDPVDTDPPPVGDLDDQLPLVKELRQTLFPDKFQPGHPDANPEGYLPLHDGEKAALWAKHLAWRLRTLGVGMVTAKPGSANHGGATTEYPQGFTTDIVALENGVHWDFQIDGHDGAAYPTWAQEENPANYPPVAARWVPAFKP